MRGVAGLVEKTGVKHEASLSFIKFACIDGGAKFNPETPTASFPIPVGDVAQVFLENFVCFKGLNFNFFSYL